MQYDTDESLLRTWIWNRQSMKSRIVQMGDSNLKKAQNIKQEKAEVLLVRHVNF